MARRAGMRFPYGDQLVAYLVVNRQGGIRQLQLAEAIEEARAGRRVFAVWPGRWRSDLLELDSILAWADRQAAQGRSVPGQTRRQARCRRCGELVELTRGGDIPRNHGCVRRAEQWWAALRDYDLAEVG